MCNSPHSDSDVENDASSELSNAIDLVRTQSRCAHGYPIDSLLESMERWLSSEHVQ